MGMYRENDIVYETGTPLPAKQSTNLAYGNLIMGTGQDNKAHFLKANSDGSLASNCNTDIMQIYEDSGNTYLCYAEAGTNLTDESWKIIRFDSDGNKRKCDGNDNYDNVATDASTVAALSYS